MNLLSERIKLARSLCHFSMDELVRRMGKRAVSKMAISKFERGLMKPTPTTLQAIADACHVPLTFFSQPMPLLSQLEYRFDLSISPEQLQHIDSIVAPLLQNYFGIQTILSSDLTFVHPLPNNPLCNYADAEHAAIELRRKWEIGLQPIHSVYELLSCYGVHVIEADLGANQVFGLSTFVRASASSKGDIPIIIINACACATTERKRFTALHELCHLLFPLRPDDEVRHRAYLAALPPIPHPVTLKPPTKERLCDHFASAMLMPEPCVRRRFGSVRTSISLQEFFATRQLYGNSVASQIHRLHDLRIIEDALYHHLYNTIIYPDRKEEHLGTPYPIMETADRMPLLEERLRVELEKFFSIH